MGRGRNIHPFVKTKMAIIKGPVREGGMSEQRGSLVQCCESLKNKGVRGGGRLYMMRKGEIKGIDDHGVRDDGDVCIICSGVQMILSRKSICGSHLCSGGYFPEYVEILEKEGPASLVMRELARIFKIR